MARSTRLLFSVAFTGIAVIALSALGARMLYAAVAFSGGASVGPGYLILVSDGSDVDAANNSSAVTFDDLNGDPVADIGVLSADYFFTAGNSCGGGSPRFQIRVDMDDDGVDTAADKNIFIYFGPYPSFTGCPSETWESTGNVITATDPIFDTSQVGGTFYDTWANAIALVGNKNILGISVALDSYWSASASGGDSELTMYLDNVTIKKLIGTTYDFAYPDVTVTVVKYMDGVHATAGNAGSLSFPIDASWDAANIGAGSGSFTLSTTGFNNPNPYEATTAEMSAGADYSLAEDLTGPNVGASCAEGKPFVLSGYTTGDTEAEAAAGVPSLTPPALTNMTEDQFIIVWNEECETTLTLQKTVVNDNSGSAADTDWTLTATGPDTISGVEGSAAVTNAPVTPGTYDLSENGPPGYDAGAWVCVGGTQNDGDTVTVGVGQQVTCTITNNDQVTPPVPPANACATPSTPPPGYTLVNGTAGNDNVVIAPFTMFVGLGGFDVVRGLADGDYIVCTGEKTDDIQLGNGDFTISAGNGHNVITTGNGDGFIETGTGNDRITTGDGEQTIDAGDGYNKIQTGNGNKTVTTGPKNDQITTGGGNDVINAGEGYNNVQAGAGDDTVSTGSSNDVVNGGLGTDTCNVGGGFNSVTNCEL